MQVGLTVRVYQSLYSRARIVNCVGLLLLKLNCQPNLANYTGSDHPVDFKVYLTAQKPILKLVLQHCQDFTQSDFTVNLLYSY